MTTKSRYSRYQPSDEVKLAAFDKDGILKRMLSKLSDANAAHTEAITKRAEMIIKLQGEILIMAGENKALGKKITLERVRLVRLQKASVDARSIGKMERKIIQRQCAIEARLAQTEFNKSQTLFKAGYERTLYAFGKESKDGDISSGGSDQAGEGAVILDGGEGEGESPGMVP